MSFPRYPKYKPSGVEWLDLLPEAWSTFPLGKLTEPERPIMYGIVLPGPDVESGVPIVKGGNVKPDRLRLSNLCRTTSEIERPYARARLRGGDIVIAIRGSYGDAEIVPDELDGANITQDVARIAPDSGINNRWLLYALRSDCVFRQLDATASGATIRGLNIFNLKRAGIPVPPLPEQRAIAAFLDRETAKIDALVAEQERLIELLAEKRQAVISHAVTKGLDPHAPMKPSGVEWLGEVPVHWEARRVGAFCDRIGSGKTPRGGAEVYADEGVPFLRSQNVHDAGLDLTDVVLIPPDIDEEMASSRVQPGDILLNITGASLGRTCVAPANLGPANVSQHVCVLRISEPEIRDFVAICLRSNAVRSQIEATQNGAAREGLNFQQIARLVFALPPAVERRAIVTEVQARILALEEPRSAADAACKLLQERRSALISAAVTGQIDVRGAAAAAAS